MRLLLAGWLALTGVAGAWSQQFEAGEIQAHALEAAVRFLASKELGGRGAPSPGLDVAAQYVASEFLRAGLEPAADGNFFQDAPFLQITSRREAPLLHITGCEQAEVRVRSLRAVRLDSLPLFKWTPETKLASSLSGKVLILRVTGPEILARLELTEPDAIVELVHGEEFEDGSAPAMISEDQRDGSKPARVLVRMSDFEDAYDRLPAGLTKARVTLHAAAPEVVPILLKNVAGLLRGSDPLLRSQFVLITAHYDHIGAGAEGVYPGANDDASGTASLIALAEAFGHAAKRPKRSLLFVALTAEEEGLLGSAFYTRHPLVPLNKTIANINLEQLGRIDEREELGPGRLGVAGFTYSTLGATAEAAMAAWGVTLGELRNGESYFARSDHYSFAEVGIPAVTLVAAWEFPDYHRVTDTADKLDYGNMVKLDRAIAAAIEAVADAAEIPKWNQSERKAKAFGDRWHTMHP